MAVITERALLRRINRKLAHEGERLHKTLPARLLELGEYYCVNDCNAVTASYVELADWGRELGVLHPHEVMTDSNVAQRGDR